MKKARQDVLEQNAKPRILWHFFFYMIYCNKMSPVLSGLFLFACFLFWTTDDSALLWDDSNALKRFPYVGTSCILQNVLCTVKCLLYVETSCVLPCKMYFIAIYATQTNQLNLHLDVHFTKKLFTNSFETIYFEIFMIFNSFFINLKEFFILLL